MAKRKQKTWRRTFIKEWREYRNLTQERLAERIDRSPGLISKIENQQGPYTQQTLEAIAGALGCQPVDLLIRNPLDPISLAKEFCCAASLAVLNLITVSGSSVLPSPNRWVVEQPKPNLSPARMPGTLFGD